MLHKNIVAGDVHYIQEWEVADSAARLALSLTSADIGKVARQLDTGKFYILEDDVTPTWQIISSGGGGGSGTVTEVTSANADLTITNTTTTPSITLVQAPALRSATTTISVSSATAPTAGQVLTATSGTAANWQTPTGGGGSGDVTGPASSTDNAITRFDSTTGKIIQNSTVTLDDNGNIINANSIQFDTTPTTPPATVGTMSWDDGDGVPSTLLKGGNTTLQVGTQEYARVYNDSGSSLTKGQVVYINGAQGNRVSVRLARANAEATSQGTLGLVAESIAIGAEGFIIVSGTLYKLNTSGLTAGAPVYLSPTTAGAYTTTKPVSPDHLVVLGWIERVSTTVGSIYIKIDNGYRLDELHNVLITTPANGNTLIYDSADGLWKNGTSGGGGLTNITEAISTASPNNTVNAVSLTVTGGTTNADFVLAPKGTGGILAQVPDGASTKGAKRGIRAIDFQTSRTISTEVAGGDNSAILSGTENRIDSAATGAIVVGGLGNRARASYCFLAGTTNECYTSYGFAFGLSNRSGNTHAFAVGNVNFADGAYSYAFGEQGRANTDYSWTTGNFASSHTCIGKEARATGRFSVVGDAQRGNFVLRTSTTDATPTAISTNGATADNTNTIVLRDDTAYAFRGQIIARQNTTGDTSAIEFKGVIKRGSGSGATALVGTVTQASLGANAGASSWAVAFTASTALGGLAITVTGEASKTIRWVATVTTTEVEG